METVQTRIHRLQRQIVMLERLYGRPAGSVCLLAVSKGKSVEAITQAYTAGQRRFGESYIQEAIPKIEALSEFDIEWHFIGPIQSNKTRHIAQHFHWVHSVDRLKTAQRLQNQRPVSLPTLNICLQINISQEYSKSGSDPDEVEVLVREIVSFDRLCLRGLMAIPAASDNFTEQRHIFSQVRQVQERLIASGYSLDTLSMGMSNDMEAAIAEGATIVRIGTAIFGARDT